MNGRKHLNEMAKALFDKQGYEKFHSEDARKYGINIYDVKHMVTFNLLIGNKGSFQFVKNPEGAKADQTKMGILVEIQDTEDKIIKMAQACSCMTNKQSGYLTLNTLTDHMMRLTETFLK